MPETSVQIPAIVYQLRVANILKIVKMITPKDEPFDTKKFENYVKTAQSLLDIIGTSSRRR